MCTYMDIIRFLHTCIYSLLHKQEGQDKIQMWSHAMSAIQEQREMETGGLLDICCLPA